MKAGNKSSEQIVTVFAYLGVRVRDQIYIHKEANSRLNSGNDCSF